MDSSWVITNPQGFDERCPQCGGRATGWEVWYHEPAYFNAGGYMRIIPGSVDTIGERKWTCINGHSWPVEPVGKPVWE